MQILHTMTCDNCEYEHTSCELEFNIDDLLELFWKCKDCDGEICDNCLNRCDGCDEVYCNDCITSHKQECKEDDE